MNRASAALQQLDEDEEAAHRPNNNNGLNESESPSSISVSTICKFKIIYNYFSTSLLMKLNQLFYYNSFDSI